MARPRAISEDEALERSLLLFWEHGFDRTSISDLSAALGVGPSSIYNSFGSKEELFRRAIDRYVETYASEAMQLVGVDKGEDAVGFARGVMRTLAKLYTGKAQPPGCAIFQSGGAGTPDHSSACAVTNEIKLSLQDALSARFAACARRGDELAAPPRTLARFVVATLRGISQLAVDGAQRADLMKVVEHAARSCVTR